MIFQFFNAFFLCISYSLESNAFSRSGGSGSSPPTQRISAPRSTKPPAEKKFIPGSSQARYMKLMTTSVQNDDKTYESASDPSLLSDLTALIGSESAKQLVKKIAFAKSLGVNSVKFEAAEPFILHGIILIRWRNFHRCCSVVNLKRDSKKVIVKSMAVHANVRVDKSRSLNPRPSDWLPLNGDELTQLYNLMDQNAKEQLNAVVQFVKE